MRLPLVPALLAWLAVGCAPVVRAGHYFSAPLYRPRAARSPAHAGYRVLPPPSGCAPVAPPLIFLPALGFTGGSFADVAATASSSTPR